MRLWQRVNRLRPETVFLVVAGAFGLACAAVTPPFQSPDEAAHLFRCFQLSEGHVVAVHRTPGGGYAYGGDLPVSLLIACEPFLPLQSDRRARIRVATIAAEFRRPLRAWDRTFLPLPSTALYSPVPYAPAVACVWAARELSLPPVALLYAGRLGTWAGFLAVGWAAVRATPILKWPAVLLLCSPLMVFLAGSVSADPLTIGVAFLASALVLRGAVGAAGTSGPASVALAAVMVAVALCKSLYTPIAAMALVVRPRRFPWATRAAVVIAAVAAAAAWSAVTAPLHVRQAGDDPARQLAWVTHHPAAFAAVLGRTALARSPGLAFGSIGSLGLLDTQMSVPFVGTYLLAILALSLVGEPTSLRARPRIMAAGIIAASVGLIALGTYLVWDPIGAPLIEGLQGRYFLPLSLLACAVVRRGGRIGVRSAWVFAALTSSGTYTLWTLAQRYYLPG